MKLRTIRACKYMSYFMAGIGQLVTGAFVITRGDLIKQGFGSFNPTTSNTQLAMTWGVAALVAIYFPVLARHYQSLQDRYRLTDSSFVKVYRENLASAINDLEDVRKRRKTCDSVELGILRTIVNIVRYYVGAGDEAGINANLMLPVLPNDPRCIDVKFIESPEGLTMCRWLLKLERWARLELEVPDFCLPVYDPVGVWRNKILFGAPQAFVTGEPVIINHTLRLKGVWASGVSDRVKAQLKDYFNRERKVLKSFVSLPVVIGTDGYPEAVINIHWNRKKILGKSSGLVIDLLLPFLLVLAYVRRAAP